MIVTDSRPGSARPNEDWVGTATTETGSITVVLDGLTAPDGVGGCIHDTPWYVSRLGHHLLTAASGGTPLQGALREAIASVSAEHADTCDLSDPGTPSSTVAVVRVSDAFVEALVLADSPVVVDLQNHGVDVVTDQSVETVVQAEREAALAAPAGSQEKAGRMAELVRAQRLVRNTPNGYWIAGSTPDAADHAVERSWARNDVRRFAAMTDGASCLVEPYQAMSWTDLLNTAQKDIGDVIDHVRLLEATDPVGARWPRYKTSDDATIAYVELVELSART